MEAGHLGVTTKSGVLLRTAANGVRLSRSLGPPLILRYQVSFRPEARTAKQGDAAPSRGPNRVLLHVAWGKSNRAAGRP